MLASKFIETELNAFIEEQRLTESPLMVTLICKAFEAYDQYRRLVSGTNNGDDVTWVSNPVVTDNKKLCTCNTKAWDCGPWETDEYDNLRVDAQGNLIKKPITTANAVTGQYNPDNWDVLSK